MSVEARAASPQHTPEAITGSDLPANVIPESVFLNKLKSNEEIVPENVVPAEVFIEKLGAKKGAEKWAVANTINQHSSFIRRFAQTKAHLEANFGRKNIAAHELGHAHVVRSVGGSVEEISIVPNGRVLGFTRYRLQAMRSLVQMITTRIACAAGSRIAEEKVGEHNHCGCAGDDGSIRMLAAAGERASNGTYSAGWLESEGRKIARSAMSSYSATNLEQDSISLLEKHPVAVIGKPIPILKFINRNTTPQMSKAA